MTRRVLLLIGFKIEPELAKLVDEAVQLEGLPSRSDFLRMLICRYLGLSSSASGGPEVTSPLKDEKG